DSRHSRNLTANRSAAITIYDSHQTWGGFDRGMQLFGTAYPFYRFRPREVKLFHERILGGGTLVTAKVDGERLAWARPITTARRSQRRPTTKRAPIPPLTSPTWLWLLWAVVAPAPALISTERAGWERAE